MRRFNGLCVLKTIAIISAALLITLMCTNFLTTDNTKLFQRNWHESEQLSKKVQLLPLHQALRNDNSIQKDKFNELEIAQHNRNNEILQELEKKDWHDRQQMISDKLRSGLGEQGQAAKLLPEDKQKEQEIFRQNGFNGYLSDKISLNRSLPDIRNKGCLDKKYLTKLPSVSIIIPVYNEHWSTLLRSCYSILNRSPDELIYEIILVDDFSDKDFLGKKLDKYVAKYLPKVKIVRLDKRSGLIIARIAGAKVAKAEVLIFLDSHIEVNYNWLPPLLEPIALNPKASVCPFIDVIDHDNFAYRAQDEGARGAFDWEFYYKRLPLLPEDEIDRTKPFRSPIMAGGLFAIGAKFFWELGGYDPGLDIWGGEQYELSFKIWMCGGELLDAPCSRVGHIYRGSVPFRNPRKTDYLHRNYKRVAEVWMDNYAKYLYERNENVYRKTDAGDLTEQKALRKRLQCKSFDWFMKEIAFDLPKKYPPVEPPDYAHGIIRSVGSPLFCLDTLNVGIDGEIGLFSCASDRQNPHSNQNWALSWHKDLRQRGKTNCLDVSQSIENAPVILYPCHSQQGNQLWFYDEKNKLLIHGKNNRCLEANPKTRSVYVNPCDSLNKNMQWNFGIVNSTALANFNNDIEHK